MLHIYNIKEKVAKVAALSMKSLVYFLIAVQTCGTCIELGFCGLVQ